MNSLFGLEYEFVQEKDTYIIFKGNEELLSDTSLAKIDVNMLLANSIPRLLPIEIDETDLKIQLRYNISKMKILSYFLKEREFKEMELFRLLLQVLTAIDDSKIYMLSENNYILDKELIFVGKDINEIYLIYLPLTRISKKSNLQDEIKNLIFELYGYVKNFEGNNFKDIISFMNKDKLNIAELKRKILSFIETKPNQTHQKEKISFHVETPRIHEEKKTPKESLNNEEMVTPKHIMKNQNKRVDNKIIKKEQDPQQITERQKVIYSLGTIIFISIIWRIYLSNANEGLLYISLGLTVLVLDAFIFLLKLRPLIAISSDSSELIASQYDVPISTPRNLDNFIKKKEKGNPAKETKKENHTTILRSDATVLLTEANLEEKHEAYYLEVNRGEQIERIKVNGDRFLIGRNPLSVDYVEESTGVSRMHLELIKTENGYSVKDLSSKNGSYLNEEALIPNKHYEMKEGDVIKIANLEYRLLVVKE